MSGAAGDRAALHELRPGQLELVSWAEGRELARVPLSAEAALALGQNLVRAGAAELLRPVRDVRARLARQLMRTWNPAKSL